MDKKPGIVEALLIINLILVNTLYRLNFCFYAFTALAFFVFGYVQIKSKLVHIIFVLLSILSFSNIYFFHRSSELIKILSVLLFNLSTAFIMASITNSSFNSTFYLASPSLFFILFLFRSIPFQGTQILIILSNVVILIIYCINLKNNVECQKLELSPFSVMKMKAPRFFILLSCVLIFSLTLVLKHMTVMMALALALGSLFALVLLKKFSKALLLITSSAMSLIISFIILRTSKIPHLDFILGFFIGIFINSVLSYSEFANNAISLFAKEKVPSLLTGLYLFLGYVCILLTNLLPINQSSYLIIATMTMFALSFILILCFSKTLGCEEELKTYLKEGGNIVSYEKLLINTVYKTEVQKRPNLFLYFVSILLVKFFCYFILGQRIKNKVKIKGPGIVLSNHASFYDFLFVGSVCFPHRVNFLASSFYFSNKAARPWLRLFGVISKHQFAADLAAIKKLKYVVCQKDGLAFIAPEGTVYANGKLGYISPAIVKIIKNFKVPVYVVKIQGAGLGKGKWQKHLQRNEIDVSLSKILTEDQTVTMDSDLIYETIINALDFNEFKFQKEHSIKVHGKKRAEGLENLLYLCPNCHKELTLKTEGNEIHCTDCDLKATINDDFCFEYEGKSYFENYTLWFDYQYNELKNQMMTNPDFTLSIPVIYKVDLPDVSGHVVAGEGTLTLSLKDGWTYEGTYFNKQVIQNDPLSCVPIVTVEMGQDIELPYKDGHCRIFVFKQDAPLVQKWHIASRIITECHLA